VKADQLTAASGSCTKSCK